MASDHIAELAAEIRREVTDSRLFGRPIDWNNPDVALVAAYYIGHDKGCKYREDLIQRRDDILADLERENEERRGLWERLKNLI